MIRPLIFCTGLALTTACTQTQVYEEPEQLGEFKLRINHVEAHEAVQGPVSRDATSEEWTTALKGAVDTRLGRYTGSQEYDVGVSLGAYMLAPAGVPLIYSPKSVAIVDVTIYDPGLKKLLAKHHRIQVLEDTTSESVVVGSGHSRTKAEQMNGLALKVADEIEEWLAEEHKNDGWFDARPDADLEINEEIPVAG